LQLDRDAIIGILDNLVAILFPAHFANEKTPGTYSLKYEMGTRLSNVVNCLTDQVMVSLQQHPEYSSKNDEMRRDHAEAIVGIFVDALPEIRQLLKKDIQAGYDGDPAATSFDEIIFSYPGFYAIMVNRIAHVLYKLEVPMIPRIMTEHAHSRTGVDIHPGAQIGEYFFSDHGTGVVIGETTIIGDRVKLYQGVTLGGLSTRGGQSLRGRRRHPTIGNDVTIYSNASILGGETVIGDGCIISGNCFITSSVAPGMRVSNGKGELQIIPDKK
jgi:serine O-acetyltransferase